MKTAIIVAITLLSFGFWFQGKTDVQQKVDPEISKALENYIFKTTSGKKISLSEFKGKAVVIVFWESWSNLSVNSLNHLNRLSDQYPGRMEVIALNPLIRDSEESVKTFEQENIYKFTYSFSPELRKKVKLKKLPTTFFVDLKGKVVDMHVGAFPDVREYENDKTIIQKILGIN